MSKIELDPDDRDWVYDGDGTKRKRENPQEIWEEKSFKFSEIPGFGPKDRRVYIVTGLAEAALKGIPISDSQREFPIFEEFPILLEMYDFFYERKREGFQRLSVSWAPEVTIEEAAKHLMEIEKSIENGDCQPFQMGDLNWKYKGKVYTDMNELTIAELTDLIEMSKETVRKCIKELQTTNEEYDDLKVLQEKKRKTFNMLEGLSLVLRSSYLFEYKRGPKLNKKD